MNTVDGRFPEIDRVKGFATLCVLLIHARALEGTFFGERVVNRAVLIFLVLFGATSELWWRRQRPASGWTTLRSWYLSRFSRLIVPVWGILFLWYPLSLLFDPQSPVSWRIVLLTLTGYLTWIPTGWFVTLIFQLVVLFPALRALVRTVGPVGALLISLAVVALSFHYLLDIIEVLSWLLRDASGAVGERLFFYFWIFPPSHLYAVTAGILLGRDQWRVRTGRRPLAIVTLLLGWIALSYAPPSPTLRWLGLELLDPVLTCVCLTVGAILPARILTTRVLTWVGRHSWGLYLSQMLIYATASMVGAQPWAGPAAARWAFFFVLLVGATALVAIGNAVRSSLVPAVPSGSAGRR